MPIILSVFVILPIADPSHTKWAYDEGVAPAVREFLFEPRRIDDQAIGGAIAGAIRAQIVDSYFTIADLTCARPNCYYEVGMAHALGKATLLIAKEGESVHFDVAHHMIHRYSAEKSPRDVVRDLIPKFLMSPARDVDDDKNGEFGRKCIVNGYKLSAQVVLCNSKNCTLDLEVVSVETGRPLNGDVTFYMHHSYKKKAQKIAARDGIAVYAGVTSDAGPWTVGAVVHRSGTKLELDLCAVPGAREWWYRKAYRLKGALG